MGIVGNLKLKTKEGFTIVELLIVIVVIAILAAITVVAYTGIRDNAVASSLQQTVAQAIKKLEVLKQGGTSGLYPVSEADIGIVPSAGVDIDYFYNSTNDTYCVQALQSGKVYSSRSTDKQIVNSSCIESGLIGWWKLNGDANDSSGNSLNGVASGGPTVVVGQNGSAAGAYSFDGVDDMISLGNSPLLNPTTAGFTISVWYNRTGPLSSEKTILRKDLQYEIATMGTANIRNLMGTNGGASGWVASNDFPYAINSGTWYHLATVWDGATLKSYINGALVYTATVTGTPSTSTSLLTISSSGRHIQGLVDDLRIFHRPLTAGDIAILYSKGAE